MDGPSPARLPSQPWTGARVGKGVATATGGQLIDRVDRDPHAGRQRVRPVDDEILTEWTLDDPQVALERWREGTGRYGLADIDDIAEMRRCALLLCEGLKYCLFETPILEDDDDVIETVGNTLAAALASSKDRYWDETVARLIRLALAVARRFGVQPEELGGNGELDPLFADPYGRMRMAMSVAPGPWSCDLAVWFADQRPEM